MDFLSSIPTWAVWGMIAVTFLVVHAVSFRPGAKEDRTRLFKRIASSVLLLLALVVVQPSDPGSLLLALAASAAGGFLSGRAAPALPER